MTPFRSRLSPLIHALLVSGTALLALVACHDSSSSRDSSAGPVAPVSDCAVARVVNSNADLVPGPLARGTLGDIVIENNRLRAIIQKGGRNWFNIGQFGGNIIDAVPKNDRGELAAEDHYEEASLGTHIESSPNYQQVEIVSAGGEDSDGNCLPAVVRATGPDDLLDFVNGSSAIRDMDLNFPPGADDVDLPIIVETDYQLDVDQRAITMSSRLINQSSEDLPLYLVEYVNGSGEVELFQHGYGFGEALITAPCDSCRSIIYAGHEGGAGVSYGIVHDMPRTTTLSVSGVTVLVYGTDTTVLALVPEPLNESTEPPPFTIPADGDLTFTRWFVVGTGTVASVLDTQYHLLDIETGTLSGQVTDANGPVANAEIAVTSERNDFTPIAASTLSSIDPTLTSPPSPRGPSTIVANHLRTDANGFFQGNLPPGSYQLRLNIPGRGQPATPTVNITVAANEALTQNFSAPLAAQLRVLVVDENDAPLPAKVQLIGQDNSPDAGEPQNQEVLLGEAIDIQTGIFGDSAADRLPNGIILSEFAAADPNKAGPVMIGDTGLLDVQAGEFQLSVSRGPRYSEHVETVTLTEGTATTVTARLVKVVDTGNHLLADFHVHSFNSPDSEVTNRERLITYLAEDMDFFTPSDHGYRMDFEPLIAEMQVGQWLASAPSAEVTTFDYGHFNAWPVQIEQVPANSDEASQSADLKISRGATDWGGAAPVGQDFPSANHYSLTPKQIFEEMKLDPITAGREVVIQINHIDSHFGPGGLEIDTAASGLPQSGVDPASRRLPADAGNLYNDNYDSLELWIGVDGREHQFGKFLGQNAGDWFNLLNRDLIKTFVANSDTHDRRLTSLSTRNYISAPSVTRNGKPDPEKMRLAPHDIGDAVIAGRTTGSNALFMTVKARNSSGQQAGLEQSDDFGSRSQPLPASDSSVTLDITIQSPLWAEFDQIAVYVNGATRRHTNELGQPTEPARYELCPARETRELGNGLTRTTVPVVTLDGKTFARFEGSATIPLTLSEDSWIVVLAQGSDGTSRPLWPVVPNDFSDSGDGLNTRSPEDTGTVAMAMSNPLFVDVDGGGWQAPDVQINNSCM